MNYLVKTAILPIVLLLGCLILAPFAWINLTNAPSLPEEGYLSWNRKGEEKLWIYANGDWINTSTKIDFIEDTTDDPNWTFELINSDAIGPFGKMAVVSDIEIVTDSGIDPNMFLNTTTTADIWFWEQEPQISYVFDANSDPLMVGTMMCTWMKSDATNSSNVAIYVPLKDKAIYDAIYFNTPQAILINPPEKIEGDIVAYVISRIIGPGSEKLKCRNGRNMVENKRMN